MKLADTAIHRKRGLSSPTPRCTSGSVAGSAFTARMGPFLVRAAAAGPSTVWDGQGCEVTAVVGARDAADGGVGAAAAAAPSGRLELQFADDSGEGAIAITLAQGSIWRAGPQLILVKADAAAAQRLAQRQQQEQRGSGKAGQPEQAKATEQTNGDRPKPQAGQQAAAAAPPLIALTLASSADADAFEAAATAATSGSSSSSGGGGGGQASGAAAAAAADGKAGNVFDAKIDKTSSDMYFHYYGMLQHQQNMLQDLTRTGTYHAAITGNRPDFEGAVVMDVGAGSGILSLFAAQAGAAKVYAVEASGMAKFAARLAAANTYGGVVEVLHSKVEELSLPHGVKADVLVSEPMGTLLVNERMLETYIYARDRFLKPGGRMFPQIGRIHAAAFTDPLLYGEVAAKAGFWQQADFYGVDVTSLYEPAAEGYFSQVVVDAFDPALLVSSCATRVFDFMTCTEAELADIAIPLALTVGAPTTVHGVATWFDVLFNGTATQRWLSTAPGLPTTHWFQLRCVLAQPLVVLAPNTVLQGTLRLVAHERQSYSVLLELSAPPLQPGGPPQRSSGRYDLKEPFYRQLTSWAYTQAQVSQPAASDGTAPQSAAAAAAASFPAVPQQQQVYGGQWQQQLQLQLQQQQMQQYQV